MTSQWKRFRNLAGVTARRGDGVEIIGAIGAARESAIYALDLETTDWSVVGHVWTRDAWRVEPEEDIDLTAGSVSAVSWRVLHDGKRATVQSFRSCDRARWYAETRLDRGGKRGRKPRRNRVASVLLPTVRATPEERKRASALADTLGFKDYSSMTRALLEFAEREHATGRLRVMHDGSLRICGAAGEE